MNETKPTPVAALCWAAVIAMPIAWMVAWRFYGAFPPIGVMASILLFVMAGVCVAAGVVIRKKINDGDIGHDRSQMSPLTVAQWMLFGQAVAWIGAVLGGVYAGIAIHVLLNAAELTAAQNDVPGVLAGVLGGVGAAVAGAWLERSCVAPPVDPPMDAVAS